MNTARIVRAGATVPEVCFHNVKLGQGCFCPHCPTACLETDDCLRRFAEWAAGAACDDEYAPRMVKHIAAVAKDALAGNADIAGYPEGVSSSVQPCVLSIAVRDLLATECSVPAPYCGNAMDPVNDLRLVSGRKLEKVRAALGSETVVPISNQRDAHILLVCAEQLENYSFHEYGKELRRIAMQMPAVETTTEYEKIGVLNDSYEGFTTYESAVGEPIYRRVKKQSVEPTCSTCGRTKENPDAKICSNSFHLPEKASAAPVAWMTDEDPPRVASAYSREGMHEPMKKVFCIPLYRGSGH